MKREIIDEWIDEEYDNTIYIDEVVGELPTKKNYDLPKIVHDYVKVSSQYSIDNGFPAMITFFMILGQTLKDFYTIPVNALKIDPRVHFGWFQTARTGKTAIWAMLQNVSSKVFETLNERKIHHCDDTCSDYDTWHSPITDDTPEPELIPILCGNHGKLIGTKFDIFEIVEATDAALIGSYAENKQFDGLLKQLVYTEMQRNHLTRLEDDDIASMRMLDNIPDDFKGLDDVRLQRNIFITGGLEGSGLAQWDEFESSGIFKRRNHNENVLVYFQKFMNGLESQSHLIRKKLASGDEEIICDCQRSFYGTTYVPHNFLDVLANSGALQRALIFIKEIDEETLISQREKFIEGLGEEYESAEEECERFAKAMVKIHDLVEERLNSVEQQKSKVFTFDPNTKGVLKISYKKMEFYTRHHNPKIRNIARTFQINMLQYEMIFSTLICAIESMSRKENKFVVTAKNMHQARQVVEKCYDYLIEWLQTSIRGVPISIADQTTHKVKIFKGMYDESKKDEEGWTNKKPCLQKVAAKIGKSYVTVWRQWNKDGISNYFDEKLIGNTHYIKWRKQE